MIRARKVVDHSSNMSSVETAQTVREDANHEPCPTPLNWQQVVGAFRDQSELFDVNVTDGILKCQRFGRGRPLYFINGMTGNCELYSLLAFVLADEFECVFYDGPDRIQRSANVPNRLAEYLFAIADRRGDQQFDVFTAGFGCVTALTAAVNQPDRIRRLVLQSGFAHRSTAWSERVLSSLFRNSSRVLAGLPLWSRINQRNHQMWFPPFDDSRWQFLEDNTGSTPVSRVASLSPAFEQFDLREKLDRVSCPALLIATEGDGRVLDECHKVLETGLMNSRTEQMDNTGQFAFLTHPHRVRKQLKRFLLDE
jgi:pimeloyl-ACP methyl ester carboxylesterase